jgi:predicted ATP-grasp superfamily ATP-dependent carboligase
MNGLPTAGSLPRAIVLDASDGGFVAARALVARGVPVTVLATAPNSWTLAGRGIDGRLMPAISKQRDAWLEMLGKLGRSEGVLIPASDPAVELLARERAGIPAALHSFEGPDSAHLKLMDKASLYSIADAAGIRIPRTERVRSVAQLEALAPDLPYPSILKPALSHRFRELFGPRRVIMAETPEQLVAEARPALDAGLEMLVLEYVPGPELDLRGAVTLRREDGSLALSYGRRKLRQFPPHFGAGSVLEAVPAPEVLEVTRRLLDAAGFVGFSSLEAKRHERTGEAVLMEINVRIPQNIGLGEACGVEPSWRLYATLAGIPLGPQSQPRYGVKTVVASLEVPAVPAYLRDGELSVRDILGSYRHVRTVSGLSLREPGPLVAFGRLKLKGLRRRVRA